MVLNMNAKQARGVIAAGVLAYERACKEGELGNAAPPRFDPVSQGFHGIRRGSEYLTELKR